MYLSEGIIDFDGAFSPMVGLLPGRTRMQRKLAALGYVRAEALADSPIANRKACERFIASAALYRAGRDAPKLPFRCSL